MSRTYEQLEPVISALDERIKTGLGAFPTDIAEGSIASFPDGADGIPVKSLVVGIEPVQAGSGDPSPDNIRPITGWTGCVISHSGADTSNPTTYPITFPSEAGTVYGGTLDVTTGVLTVDRAELVLDGDESWKYYSVLQDNLFRAVGQPTPTIIANNVSDFLCDAYKPVLALARTNGTLSSSTAGYLDFIDNGFNALDGWTAHVSQNNIHVVYPLATPVTYQLTPQEIRTLLGQNNIWVDAGDTTVEYRANTSAYIAKKIAEAISAFS